VRHQAPHDSLMATNVLFALNMFGSTDRGSQLSRWEEGAYVVAARRIGVINRLFPLVHCRAEVGRGTGGNACELGSLGES
jgi:hypothetical protein